jgi:hypothetical protein
MWGMKRSQTKWQLDWRGGSNHIHFFKYLNVLFNIGINKILYRKSNILVKRVIINSKIYMYFKRQTGFQRGIKSIEIIHASWHVKLIQFTQTI